jgi:hypothetical protein
MIESTAFAAIGSILKAGKLLVIDGAAHIFTSLDHHDTLHPGATGETESIILAMFPRTPHDIIYHADIRAYHASDWPSCKTRTAPTVVPSSEFTIASDPEPGSSNQVRRSLTLDSAGDLSLLTIRRARGQSSWKRTNTTFPSEPLSNLILRSTHGHTGHQQSL